MVPALSKVRGQDPDDFRPDVKELSPAVTVCSNPLSSQFQTSCWPTLTRTSFGLKAVPLMVTGPSPTAGTVVWETLTSPPVSLLQPVPTSVTARSRAAGKARARTPQSLEVRLYPILF